jgi:hypothetical protein
MTPRIRIVLVVVALFCLPLRGFAQETTPLASTAEKLYASLTDDQKKQATLQLDDPERNKEVFTGGARAGIKIRTLNDEQKKMAQELLTAFASDYGKQKAIAIANQTTNNPPDDPGFERYYLCYFGDVGPGKSYAWRIAEHHLTLVHVEVTNGKPTTFGPILLGADPPTLWDDEEDKMIALWSAMTPAEREKALAKGKGISTARPKGGEGIVAADLSRSAKLALMAVIENREQFFAEPVRQEIGGWIDRSGGVDALRVVFYGAAEKKCRDGGRWDFKLAGPSFLCDYEGTRGHIHLSMKGKLADRPPGPSR